MFTRKKYYKENYYKENNSFSQTSESFPYLETRGRHESCPGTPCYSPPEVTRSPHGLLHHTNGCTSPKTTFPINHCTDVTQLIALITQLIALITNHTADCTDH